MSSDLKPCPFCGNPDVTNDEGCFPVPGGWEVLCGDPSCHAQVGGDTRAEAIAAWNRRAGDER